MTEALALSWRRPVAKALDVLLAAYQRWVSPLLPPSCRFEPSCSRYAREALRRHPWWRALGLIAWRLMRCQPLCHGGDDPVPPSVDDAGSPSSRCLSHENDRAPEPAKLAVPLRVDDAP